MAGEVNNQVRSKIVRAALYVDGFNLYHAVDLFGEPFLKWINLWKLGELIVPGLSEKIILTKYFTAKRSGDPDAAARHNTYINSLRAFGVTDMQGHYIVEPRECRKCGNSWTKRSEKQTDINLAFAVIMDGLDDAYDHAYLLSSDSNQAATARLFRERLPNKKLTSVVPPYQPVSDKMMLSAHAKIHLNKDHIERAVMPEFVPGLSGNLIRRPAKYDPPAWWVHPDKMPKKESAKP